MKNVLEILKETRTYHILKRFMKFYTALFASVYAICRVCIVVDCYRTLDYAPDEAFQRPDWSRYLVHA
jgi:hypothetical protein